MATVNSETESEIESNGYVAERIVINSGASVNYLSKLKNLWIISFAYCNLPVDISPLKEYACLGFVDISYSSLNLKQLQEAFKQTHILRLNCINVPHFKDLQHYRGFIIYTLPNVWILDGLYISNSETSKWSEFFIKNRYSIVDSKWKLDNVQHFIPTRSNTSYYSNSKPDKIWTEPARYWLLDCPKDVKMTMNYDLWKLSKFAESLEGFLEEKPNVLKSLLCHEHLGIPESSKKISLMLILIGTLFSEFPTLILHQSLKWIFKDEYPHWGEFDSSPVNWSLKDRLCFMGILIGRITMDMQSPTGRLNTKFKLSPQLIKAIKDILLTCLQISYPEKAPSDEFDYDEWNIEKIDVNVNLFTNEHATLLKLNILQLIFISPNDNLFLQHSTSIYNVYKNCVSIFRHKVAEVDLNYFFGLDPIEGLTPQSKSLEIRLCLIQSINELLKKQEEIDADCIDE
jgi:hypothetical protein